MLEVSVDRNQMLTQALQNQECSKLPTKSCLCRSIILKVIAVNWKSNEYVVNMYHFYRSEEQAIFDGVFIANEDDVASGLSLCMNKDPHQLTRRHQLIFMGPEQKDVHC